MIDDKDKKIQYILDEEGRLAEMLSENAIEVEHPINYKIRNAFEVYTRVDGTENYWISNYGRGVNNLKSKDKNTFYENRQGKRHITLFEIERCPIKNKRGVLTEEIAVNRYRRETSLEELVAKHFLKSYEGRKKIWHKDGDESNKI